MAEQEESGITWTDTTWNPIRGCSRVSEGCRNCYAERVAYRFSGAGQPYEGLVRVNAEGVRQPQWNGVVRVVEDHMLDPLRWKKPRRIFVNSMSDLFHDGVSDETIALIFSVMGQAPQHTFQVLTKRPERMQKWISGEDRVVDVYDALVDSSFGDRGGADDRAICRGQDRISVPHAEYGQVFDWKWPLPNVWLGVSVEDQQAADKRIPLLLQSPAAVRWISAEPLLTPVEISEYAWLPRAVRSDLPFPPFLTASAGLHRIKRNQHGAAWADVEGGPLGLKPDEFEVRKLDWVVAGGESGPGARPMEEAWARSLRDQCVAAGIPFHFKQWGEWLPAMCDGAPIDGQELNCSDDPIRVGKHKAGRMLDGREWDEFPEKVL